MAQNTNPSMHSAEKKSDDSFQGKFRHMTHNVEPSLTKED